MQRLRAIHPLPSRPRSQCPQGAELFAEFLTDGTHTATQTRFINEILGELTSRAVTDPACLYDPPFSDLEPTGPEDLFAEEEGDRICHLLYLIHTRVSAAQAAWTRPLQLHQPLKGTSCLLGHQVFISTK